MVCNGVGQTGFLLAAEYDLDSVIKKIVNVVSRYD
jgi:hypothetical protein